MSISSIYSTSGVSPAVAPVVPSGKTLGSADFMKLLAVQFQSQDPMKPMEDTAFIAQLAQFTSLQQAQSLTGEMAKLSKSQELIAANSFLGQQVTVSEGKAGTISGLVSGVQVSSTGPEIVVNGKNYPISSVLYVQPGIISASSIPSAGAGTV
ncbi:MAG: flagellar hook capping FlgD N-terminal domain-containing protein [Opitutae bacterium]